MRRFHIEVIARPVEVHRQQKDRVHGVLLAVGLALDKQRLLGDTVPGVGFFGVAVPEVLLAKRHQRELRIRANRPENSRLLNAVAPSGLDELDAHDRVVVEKASGVGAICADSAYNRGQVN